MFSPIDTSRTFKMHFSWVLPVKKMTLLDVTSPVLSQPIFMQLVEKRIEALHNVASRTTWTRKIKPGPPVTSTLPLSSAIRILVLVRAGNGVGHHGAA